LAKSLLHALGSRHQENLQGVPSTCKGELEQLPPCRSNVVEGFCLQIRTAVLTPDWLTLDQSNVGVKSSEPEQGKCTLTPIQNGTVAVSPLPRNVTELVGKLS